MENTTRSGTARAGRLFLVATARPADTNFFQHDFQRAEIGERRLQQVKAHKRREPEPVRAVVMREQQAGEDKRAGEPADDQLQFHTPTEPPTLKKLQPVAQFRDSTRRRARANEPRLKARA